MWLIHHALKSCQLPKQFNRGLIALIYKGGDREDLGNWRPITLFNVTYKIITKALQRCLQPLLSDVVSEDETTFLLLRYILDNVLVTHETIVWAKESQQDMILLKLDFIKAYNIVTLDFLFRTMTVVGILATFLHLVPLLVHVSGSDCLHQWLENRAVSHPAGRETEMFTCAIPFTYRWQSFEHSYLPSRKERISPKDHATQSRQHTANHPLRQ